MDPRVTTWSSLLAVWSDFARSAGALPKEGDLGLLRRSVPAIIGLQSLTHALQHMDCLPADEYCAGQDRAALLIRTLKSELGSIWRDDSMPGAVVELLDEAEAALQHSRCAGYEFVAEKDPFLMPVSSVEINAWRDRYSFDGDLLAASMGTRIRAGLPVLFAAVARGRPLGREALVDLGSLLPGCLWGRVSLMRQVYESKDPRGVRQVASATGRSGLGTELLLPVAQSPNCPVEPPQVVSPRAAKKEALNAHGSL